MTSYLELHGHSADRNKTWRTKAPRTLAAQNLRALTACMAQTNLNFKYYRS